MKTQLEPSLHRVVCVALVSAALCAALSGCSRVDLGGAGPVAVTRQAVNTAHNKDLFETLDIPASGTSARFFAPTAIAHLQTAFNANSSQSTTRSLIFVADTLNSSIRRVELTSGMVSTFAGTSGLEGDRDGALREARFRKPRGLVVSETRNEQEPTDKGDLPTQGIGRIYVADTENHTIRSIDFSGNVRTIAGLARVAGYEDGSGASARFTLPSGLAFCEDATQRTLYVADTGNARIRRVALALTAPYFDTPANAVLSVDTVAEGFAFKRPVALAVAGASGTGCGTLYIADVDLHAVLSIDLTSTSEMVTVVSGGEYGHRDTGASTTALLAAPFGLAVSDDTLYVSDAASHTVRAIDRDTFAISTLAGNPGRSGLGEGGGEATELDAPAGLSVFGNQIFVAEQGSHIVRKLDASTGEAALVAGTRARAGSVDGWLEEQSLGKPEAIACTADKLYTKSETGYHEIDIATSVVRTLSPAPLGAVIGAVGTTLYVGTAYGRVLIDLISLQRQVPSISGSEVAFHTLAVLNGQDYHLKEDDLGFSIMNLSPAPEIAAPAWLTASSSYLYAVGAGGLYRVTPGSAPEPIGPRCDQGDCFSLAETGDLFAVDETHLYWREGFALKKRAMPIGTGAFGAPQTVATIENLRREFCMAGHDLFALDTDGHVFRVDVTDNSVHELVPVWTAQ